MTFLLEECDRHLVDNKVTEGKIQEIKIALSRFHESFDHTMLEPSLEQKVQNLKLDFSLPESKDAKYLFGFVQSLGRFRWEERKTHALKSLRDKLSHLIIEFKLIG